MNTLLFSFLAALTFGTGGAQAGDLPYRDGDFGCFTQAEAQKYLTDFSVDVQSFGGLELCNNARDTKRLLNDFSLIEQTRFRADQSQTFIQGIIPAGEYYSWMKSQTYGVQRGNDIPYAGAYNSGGYFTMQDGWAILSSLGRVGMVIHEARHTAGYPHYRCVSGPYANTDVKGCDTSLAQKGSHGVEMEYYSRVVLDAENVNPVYRSMARLMALGRANAFFNEKPMRVREGLLALGQGKLTLADGAQVFTRELPAAEAGARLKRTSHGASLVKGQKAVSIDLYEPKNFGASLTDDISYFKLFQTRRPGAPASVLDAEEFDLGNLRYFVALDQAGGVSSYDFARGEWARGGSAAGAQAFVTRAPSGQAGLFVVKSDGSILPFDPAARRLGAPLQDRWTNNTLAYANLGNQLVMLTSTGSVLDARTGAPVPAFAGQQVTDLVNVPLYDAFELAR